MKLHEELWEKIKEWKIYETVKRHLEEVLDWYKENREETFKVYERVINESFLENCENPFSLYAFLLLKLSLSERSGDLNVLSYQFKKLQEEFNKSSLKNFGNVLELLTNPSNFPLERYRKLERELYYYRVLEEISKKDEELESILAGKIVKYIIRHPFKTRKILREVKRKSFKEICSSILQSH